MFCVKDPGFNGFAVSDNEKCCGSFLDQLVCGVNI